MIFLLVSVVPLSTDTMCGPFIRVYAPLAPLWPPTGELATVTAADIFVVLIRSLDLDVIWSSLEVPFVRLAA
jgi:hypothetical protein